MKNTLLRKLIAVVMLAVSLAAVPMIYEPSAAIAAARRKKKSKARRKSAPVDARQRDLDRAARQFIREEKIPQSVVNSGEIYAIVSYGSMFKAIYYDPNKMVRPALYARPDYRSRQIMKLKNGTKLIADAEFVGHSGGDWYYVHVGNKAKGWVPSEFIISRDPD